MKIPKSQLTANQRVKANSRISESFIHCSLKYAVTDFVADSSKRIYSGFDAIGAFDSLF